MAKIITAVFMTLPFFGKVVSFPKASSVTMTWTYPAGFKPKKGKFVAVYLKDSVTRITVNQTILYRLRGSMDFSGKLNPNTQPYFIYNAGDTTGIGLENVGDTSHYKRMSFAAFLVQHENQVDCEAVLPQSDSFRQVSSSVPLRGRYCLIKTYVAKYPSENGTRPDSVKYYFSHFSYPGVWISKLLDSAMK